MLYLTISHDKKSFQTTFCLSLFLRFVLFYVLSRFCISAMHTASLWSNKRQSDIVFTQFYLAKWIIQSFLFFLPFLFVFLPIICFVAHLNIFSCIIKNKYYIYYFQTALVIILSNSTDELNFSVPSRHVTMKRNLRFLRAAFQW